MKEQATRPDLGPVHDRLKGLLEPFRQNLTVAQDGSAGMTLELSAQLYGSTGEEPVA